MRGFSWKRAVGISSLKGKISRKTGVPMTKSGRARKWGFWPILSRAVANADRGLESNDERSGCGCSGCLLWIFILGGGAFLLVRYFKQ